jgi:predicted RNA binding protein YcfA (HicA-like mRNA interferase family)
MNKDIKKVLKQAKKQGWELHRKNKHYIYKHRVSGNIVTVSGTASNRNAARNIRKDFINNM